MDEHKLKSKALMWDTDEIAITHVRKKALSVSHCIQPKNVQILKSNM